MRDDPLLLVDRIVLYFHDKEYVEDYVLYSEINMIASIWLKEYICSEFERVYVLNAAVLDAIQDGLNKNKPDRAWPFLQSYYNDSHLNRKHEPSSGASSPPCETTTNILYWNTILCLMVW